MFVCEKCIEERMEYAHGVGKSYGSCELCLDVTTCLDARHYKCKPRQGGTKRREKKPEK